MYTEGGLQKVTKKLDLGKLDRVYDALTKVPNIDSSKGDLLQKDNAKLYISRKIKD
ncbi:hypothetical protein KIN20_015471 [Parelaphostrongylus tenuis]|uniref:Uncharacterized protein n=1 Tax=Parelaphostrongylus tenuis TaxID=148309 RepID=A0AAD5MIJ3_PARTN|nr:hypothetical protein KIN20_015471 [Parelaphostrongylus tenuis]